MTDTQFRVDAPVIIVGGGPVGLSLALGLAHYRVRSIVLERRTEAHRESRAVVIWTRSLEILRDWEVYAPLRESGDFVTHFRTCNSASGAALVDVDFGHIDDVVEDPGILLIPQCETERVLRALIETNPYCELRSGIEVTGLRQSNEHVELQVAGTEVPILRAAFVAGCDGPESTVRNALGLSLEGSGYNSRMVLSDESIAVAGDPETRVRVALDRPGIAVAVRFASNRWRVIAPIAKGMPDVLATRSDIHRARLERLFGPDVAAETSWSGVFSVARRNAQRFSLGRVALAGDAAHINSPAGGQGMNAGIQDVANLAWKLAAALEGRGDWAALIESYGVERREMISDNIERSADAFARLGVRLSPRMKRAGARIVARAVRASGMQRKLCRGLGMLSGRYTKSPIVDSRHPLAGRRIADLRLPDGSRINRARAGDAAIVLIGDGNIGDLPAITLPEAPKRWHVRLPVALIVRPDGCVASVIEKPNPKKIEIAWNRAFCGTLPLPQKPA